MYLLDALPAQIRSVSVRKSASGNTLNKIFNVSVNACSHFHSLSTTSTSLISVTRCPIHTERSFIGQHQHSVFYIQILVSLTVFSSTVTKQVRFECLAEWLMVSRHSIIVISHYVPHSFPHPLPPFSLCFCVIFCALQNMSPPFLLKNVGICSYKMKSSLGFI